ncbi:MAG: hypothetical protein N2692_02355 [Patescibacteria group bacterium]|jgi:hypothetical protein|nr:hypothetical protein [Patescibacteria group bacterium]
MYKIFSAIKNIQLLGLQAKPILAVFSLLAFVLDLTFSVYFFIKYLKSQKQQRIFLYISLVLFFVYWTRLPFALNLLGFTFVVERIYWVFAVALPLYLIALILIILVLRTLCSELCQKRVFIFLHAWAVVAFIVMFYYFVAYKGLFSDYIPVKTLYYIFIFPARIFILLVALRLLFDKQTNLLKIQKIGPIILIVNNLLGALLNYFNYSVMLSVPPAFWFLPVAGYSISYIWELINSILLIVGFLFITSQIKFCKNIN